MNDCIFCKIIKGEIPSYKIYEDDDFLAFLDIKPISKGQSLIIPKYHVERMHMADDKTIKDIFVLTKKIMLNSIEKFSCDYVQIAIVGEEVPHFHVKLIPRNFKDDLVYEEIKEYKEGEMEEIINRIKM